jgi:hypothetical protein
MNEVIALGKFARVGVVRAGSRDRRCAEERKRDLTGPLRIEVGIAGRHRYMRGLRVPLPGQVEVMVQELTPDPKKIACTGRVGLRAFLFDHDIADDPRVGPIGDHGAGAVGEMRFRQSQQG